jgi:hypothetical protein
MYVPEFWNISPPTGITKEEDQMSEQCLFTLKFPVELQDPKREVLPLVLVPCALNSIKNLNPSRDGVIKALLNFIRPRPQSDKDWQIAEPSLTSPFFVTVEAGCNAGSPAG